jgi:hypothetical protein
MDPSAQLGWRAGFGMAERVALAAGDLRGQVACRGRTVDRPSCPERREQRRLQGDRVGDLDDRLGADSLDRAERVDQPRLELGRRDGRAGHDANFEEAIGPCPSCPGQSVDPGWQIRKARQ